MAKFHTYYVLCPLIDQKSFLGVSQDKEEHNVIVTLGRNVVNKYRLSDQKQIGGWTSKDHITSEVIYDKERDAYIGVFNKNTIKTWQDDSDNLDKVKKYKFSVNIQKLLPRGNTSLIIFENGNCASLTYALDNRKSYENKLLIKDSEVIVEAACYTKNNVDHICYIVKNSKGNYEVLVCPLREELGDMERSKLMRVKVTRPEDVSVVGKFININSKSCEVYFLWSDSKMTMYDLNQKNWKTIGVVPWIFTGTSVSLAWMGHDHLILFGSNIDQDGAIIVAYNVILGVGSCRYPMKMYSEDARLYCFNDRIILEASNHIGMLPYVLEIERNLASILGSHEIIQDECTEIADWGTPTVPMYEVKDDIKDLLKIGLTERNICSQIIPPLLEKDDFRPVYRTIKEFQDVPESVLVMLLNYTVKLVNPNSVDIVNEEEFIKLCSCNRESKKETIVHKAKFELLNYIFEIPFSDAMLIPYLRNSLALDDALFLMCYISYLLIDSDKKLEMDYESKLFDWATLFLDSFYQQYLMTKDQKVTYALDKLQNVVVNLINQLTVVDSTLPLLNKILSGKNIVQSVESSSYAIELMKI
ncbi:nucleolar protein 11 [Epargyreus clarus]|uniref:nucleolar protein 11 n=1 Tax=Epargyreus clarus TaxID=520877 RepID=UPI003C303A1D